MTRRTGIVVLSFLLAIVLASLWLRAPRPTEGPELSQRVVDAIETSLQQTVSITVDFEQNAGVWGLLCGTVVSPDGSAITTPEDTWESADYCALLDLTAAPKVVELDMGSTDMPAMDWMEAYDLPDALFKEP